MAMQLSPGRSTCSCALSSVQYGRVRLMWAGLNLLSLLALRLAPYIVSAFPDTLKWELHRVLLIAYIGLKLPVGTEVQGEVHVRLVPTLSLSLLIQSLDAEKAVEWLGPWTSCTLTFFHRCSFTCHHVRPPHGTGQDDHFCIYNRHSFR